MKQNDFSQEGQAKGIDNTTTLATTIQTTGNKSFQMRCFVDLYHKKHAQKIRAKAFKIKLFLIAVIVHVEYFDETFTGLDCMRQGKGSEWKS